VRVHRPDAVDRDPGDPRLLSAFDPVDPVVAERARIPCAVGRDLAVDPGHSRLLSAFDPDATRSAFGARFPCSKRRDLAGDTWTARILIALDPDAAVADMSVLTSAKAT